MAVYLIDFENVGEAGMKGIENLKEDDTIIVFYSEKSSKISIDILNSNHSDLKFIKADVGTKNALDFQLVSYLGYLAKGLASETAFHIISKDTGYTPLVTFWKRYGVDVKLAVDLVGNTVPVEKAKVKAKKKEEAVVSKSTSALENLLNSIENQREEIEKEQIKKAVAKHLKNKEVEDVVKIVSSAKKEKEIKEALNLYFDNKNKVTILMSVIKPLLKNKK